MLFSVAVLPLLSLLAAASPTPRWSSPYAGAVYFQTNGFEDNQIVASYITPDGALEPYKAYSTQGKGLAGNNGPPYGPHPDPFYGDGSVVVAGDYVYAVNAGSNTFSVFKIDKNDAASLTFVQTCSSVYEFPASLAVSADGQMTCVFSSGKTNGIACYQLGKNGYLSHMGANDRPFGFNSTTPPTGPAASGNPSQMAFSPDGKYLLVAIKGFLPTDPNNASKKMMQGFIGVYTVSDYSLSKTYVKNTVPAPAGFPFSIQNDLFVKDAYFSTDVLDGALLSTLDSTGHLAMAPAAIMPQAATCWAAQSRKTKNYVTVDTGGLDKISNVTEVAVDWEKKTITQVKTANLGLNAIGTDNAIAVISSGYEYMWTLAAGFESVYSHSLDGDNIEFVQLMNFSDPYVVQKTGISDPNPGYAGMAVYVYES